MKLLLDTHALIWWHSDVARLPQRVFDALHDPANVVLLSVVSVWEMVIKHALGKLDLQDPIATIVDQQRANGVGVLDVTINHVLQVANLPVVHHDPFDRLLSAQAAMEGATLVTSDAKLSQYGGSVLW